MPIYPSYRKSLSRIRLRNGGGGAHMLYLVAQNFGASSKASIDAMIRQFRGKITDLEYLCYEQSSSPRQVVGLSKLCNLYALRIGGLTVLGYLIRACHDNGIRVHLWTIMYPWTGVWGGATSMLLTPMPDDANHHWTAGASMVNFDNANTRAQIANTLYDFAICNPGLDGITLDYIRIAPSATCPLASVSLLVEAVRDALRGFPLGYHSRPDRYSTEGDGQYMAELVANNSVSYTKSMNYSGNIPCANEVTGQVVDLNKIRIFRGMGFDPDANTNSGLIARMRDFQKSWDWPHIALFQYIFDHCEAVEFQMFVANCII